MLKALRNSYLSIRLKLLSPFVLIIILILAILLPGVRALITARMQTEADIRLQGSAESVLSLMESSEDQSVITATLIAEQFNVRSSVAAGTESAVSGTLNTAKEALNLQELSLYGPDHQPGDLPIFFGGAVSGRRFQTSEEARRLRDELIIQVIETRAPAGLIVVTPQTSQILGASPVFSLGASTNTSVTGVLVTSTLIDNAYVQNIGDIVGVEIALVSNNKPVVSTIPHATGYELTLQGDFLSNLQESPGVTLVDEDNNVQYRMLGTPLILNEVDQGILLVSQPTTDLQAVLRDIGLALSIFSAIVVAATSIFGIGVVLGMARPITQLSDAASAVSQGDLDQRVDVMVFPRDEISDLGDSFNTMTDRLQTLYTGLEREVEERTKELAVARDQALEASRTKSAFLATMSHELRTPLNSIIGYSQMMSRGMTGDLTDKQTDYVERILRNGKHLLSLINDVLDIAKIEAGRMEIVNNPFIVEQVISSVSSQMIVLAEQKKIGYVVNIAEDMPTQIIGDASRIKQIAINLTSNAIKFTDEGAVTISIRPAGNEWELIVSDTGAGIPSHMQEVIFDEFRQVDQTTRREHGGTGLGLAIVRNLCVMMGGTVRVNSKIGEGSVFTVRLPLEPVRDSVAEAN